MRDSHRHKGKMHGWIGCGGGVTHVRVEVGDEENSVEGGGGHAVDGHPPSYSRRGDGEGSESPGHRLHGET